MKIVLLLFVFLKSCTTRPQREVIEIQRFEYNEKLTLPRKEEGMSSYQLGGFSGLACLKADMEKDFFRVLVPMDRGPNSDPIKDGAKGQDLRPFFDPSFSPAFVVLEKLAGEKKLVFKQVLPLKNNGKWTSGLPNAKGIDEQPIDENGRTLGYDEMGLDIEGVAIDSRGIVWGVEEYGPSLLKINFKGEILGRWIPQESLMRAGIKKLPSQLLKRRNNRGFEGIGIAKNKGFLFLQSPYEKGSRSLPVLEFDLLTEEVLGMHTYPLDQLKAEKIGDAFGLEDGSLLVLEQDGVVGSQGIRKIFRVWMTGERVRKEEFLDLAKLGINEHEKLEGLTLIGADRLLLVADNDFGVGEKEEKSEFVLVKLSEKLPWSGCLENKDQ